MTPDPTSTDEAQVRRANARRIERRAWIAFLLCLCTGLAAALAWYWQTAARYTAFQLHTGDAVSGLMIDAPVEFHGVEVGRVASIALDSPVSVNIVLKIKKDTPISARTVATITSRGLAPRGFMGYVYVALEDSGKGQSALAYDPRSHLPLIAAAPSNSISLDAAIRDANANVESVSAAVRAMLNPQALARLDTTLKNMESVSNTLAANTERLNGILANAEQASRQTPALVQSGNDTLKAMQTQIPPLLQAGNDTLRTMQTQIPPLLQAGNDTFKTMQDQLLPEAYRTFSEMQALSRSMAGMVDELNRNPSLLLRGGDQPPPGPGEREGKH